MTARVIAFALVLAGCLPDPPLTLGAQCDLNSDCAPPFVCRLERCRKWCATSRDCDLRAACVYADGLGTCLLPDELDCAMDSDCPGDLLCSNERCVNECEEDRDCPPGSTCEGRPDGPPACSDPFESRCVRPSDCPADLVCARDARCRPECLTSYDCLADEACVGDPGACLPVALDGGAPGDGGLDAGSDASMDAVRPDGGRDAGGGDADLGDAGVLECARALDCPSAPNATLGCSLPAGRCIVESCAAGFADCDFDPENGCEIDTNTDAGHCGGCDIRCLGAGGACLTGVCDAIADVAAGGLHQCYLRESGSAFCWGANGDGQVGDGTGITPRTEPVAVRGLTDAIDIVAGWRHTCALRRDGSVACWGENGNGQLGSGTTTDALEPSPVALPEAAVSIGAGEEHTCAVLAGGDLRCWGTRANGQLGDGTSSLIDVLTPQPAMTTLDYRLVVAGDNHSCGVRTDGTVSCWGSRGATGVGIGTGLITAPPDAPIAFVSDVVAIDTGPGSVSSGTTCAIASTGELWCWGALGGVGSPSASLFAVRPIGLARVRAAGAGNNAVCAVAMDRRLHCWGLMPSDAGLADVELVDVGGSQVIASTRNGELYLFLYTAAPALAPGFH
jgi:hypothetical protein